MQEMEAVVMTTNTTIALPPSRARKTHCPKCATLHIEPSTPVYKCPSCFTLLSDRHRPAQANNSSMDGRVHGIGIHLNNVRLPDGKFESMTSIDASSSEANESNASDRSIIGIRSDKIDEKTDKNKEGNSGKNVCDDENVLLKKLYEDNAREFPTNHVSASPLYPPLRSSSDSYTASTESSDKNLLSRHFSGIGSFSFVESETDVFSPLWSSAENMDMPEVDSPNGNSSVAHYNNDLCHMIDPHFEDGENGNFTHIRKYGEKLWLSQSSNASDSQAIRRINTRRRLKLEADKHDNDSNHKGPIELVASSSGFSPYTDSNSKYCNNVAELSCRVDSSDSVCQSFGVDVGKKKGAYFSSSIVSRSKQSSNSRIGDNKNNNMDVKTIHDLVTNDSWTKPCRGPSSQDNSEKNLPQFNISNSNIDLSIDQDIPLYQKSPPRVFLSESNVSDYQGGNKTYCGSLENGDASFLHRTFNHQVYSLNAMDEQEQNYEKLKITNLQGTSYEQHHLNSSSFPCEMSRIMHLNGPMMSSTASHQTDNGSNREHKQIHQLASMAHDHHPYRNHISFNQNQVNGHYIQMGNSTLFRIKESMHPPFPGAASCPYVVCQSCCKILQVPTHLHVLDTLQKLKCSACQKTSRFNVLGHNKHPSTIRKVSKIDEQKFASHSIYFSPEAYKIHGFDEVSPQNGHFSSCPYRMNRVYYGSHKALDGTNNDTLFGFRGNSESKCETGSEPIATISKAHRVSDGHWRRGMQRNTSGGINEAYVFSTSFNTGSDRSIPSRSFGGYGPFDLTNYDDMNNEEGRVSSSQSNSSSLTRITSRVPHKGSGNVIFKTHLGFDGGSYITENKTRESIENRETQNRSTISDMILMNRSKSWGVPPGSPLIEHFFNDPSHVGSKEDLRNALQGLEDDKHLLICSPAPGSPLFRHLSYDSMFDLNKKNVSHHHTTKNVPRDETMSFQGFGKGSRDLARLFRKGIKELGKGGKQHSCGQHKVVVNGHVIPEAVLKRVEARTGPIYPGTYWYDYRAGFWGVIGGPCVGIIPPFIEELNFPLARNCGGGDTTILVNGRELHEEDLFVLSSRGLPTTLGKSYTIDINGQVLDTTTPQQLFKCNLGRLAPSMERRGRGYGMYQPPCPLC